MANTAVIFKEIRFVIQGGFTEVYVKIEVPDQSMPMLAGWHYKAFDGSIPACDIITGYMWQKGDQDSDPMYWPKKMPESGQCPLELARLVGEMSGLLSIHSNDGDPMVKDVLDRVHAASNVVEIGKKH